MKYLVYTVNLGKYDRVIPLKLIAPNTKYILFTDDPEEKPDGWEIRLLPPEDNPALKSREIKINIHKFIKGNYQVFIYLDANYRHHGDVTTYARMYFKKGMLLHMHGKRKCLFQEGKKAIHIGRGKEEDIKKQLTYYSMSGMVRNYGLFQNGFFIRDKSFNKFCELWYDQVEQYTTRDQISLPYCVFKYKPPITVMHGLHIKRYLELQPHKKLKSIENRKRPKVWYFTPGRGDKNLGRSYNDHCNLVPNGDWICIRDGDTMFLNPYWPKQIEDIIINHGHKYNLISCLTNRLGLDWQLPRGFSEDPDVLNHAKIADEHFDEFYDQVKPSRKATAGLFMLFPKSTWEEVRFLDGITNEGTFVDFSFSDTVRKRLGGIGIAQGIYLFHFYRFNRANKRDFGHLEPDPEFEDIEVNN